MTKINPLSVRTLAAAHHILEGREHGIVLCITEGQPPVVNIAGDTPEKYAKELLQMALDQMDEHERITAKSV